MQRRDFVKTVGSASLLAAAPPWIAAATAADTTRRPDIDPSGGYVAAPPKAYLLTDHRLIQPGDVGWANPQGKALPLNDPPQPVIDAHAVPNQVPYGIRFVAQPARIDAVAGDPPVVPGQVLEADGSYLAIHLLVEYPPGKDLGANSTAVPTAVFVVVSHSPDGITWTPIAKPLFVHKSDTDTTVLYDEWLRAYVMYTRLYPVDRRVVAICEAEDFRRWGPGARRLRPDRRRRAGPSRPPEGQGRHRDPDRRIGRPPVPHAAGGTVRLRMGLTPAFVQKLEAATQGP